ncbi:MAG: hypothetical protein R2932_41565 [Caldilineaceae bacterium]
MLSPSPMVGNTDNENDAGRYTNLLAECKAQASCSADPLPRWMMTPFGGGRI